MRKVVFGSGFGGYSAPPDLHDGTWQVRFVRGPQTARLMKLDPKLALVDPAILVRGMLPAKPPGTLVSFMPHWESLERGDWPAACRLAGINMIDPSRPVDEILAELQGSRLLVTEAMHGAIVADALRIPWIAAAPIHQRNRMKWNDWASSLDFTLRMEWLAPSSLLEAYQSRHRLLRGGIRVVRQLPGARLAETAFVHLAARRLTKLAAREPCLSPDGAIDRVMPRLLEEIQRFRADFPVEHKPVGPQAGGAQARQPAMTAEGRLFSVVLTTRNRPALLGRALDSVCAQTFRDFEIVVVDDGSRAEFAPQYAALGEGLGGLARFHALPQSGAGFGPSIARNHGVAQAAGACIAFLDDDDEWTDTEYLSRAAQSFAESRFDLHFADQAAMRADHSIIDRAIWLGDLAGVLPKTLPADGAGAFRVAPSHLLRSNGFCHLNSTIVRREFFLGLGGFDGSLRYEEDRDFYARAIDAAEVMLFSPRVVSRHHVPDPASRSTASTSPSQDRRALDQLRLLDKMILTAAHREIREYGKRHKAYTLKAIAERRAESGDWAGAWFYAAEALLIRFNLKWLAYTAWLGLKRASNPPRGA